MHLNKPFQKYLKKRMIPLLLVYVLTFCSVLSVSAEPTSTDDTQAGTADSSDSRNATDNQTSALDPAARSALIMEATTGTVIFEKNADERLRPASVTKIMTLLLIFEGLE